MNQQTALVFGLQMSYIIHDFAIGILQEDYALVIVSIALMIFGIVLFYLVLKKNHLKKITNLLYCTFILSRIYFFGALYLWTSFQIVQINFLKRNSFSLSVYLAILISFLIIFSIDYSGRLKLQVGSELFNCLSLIIFQLSSHLIEGKRQYLAKKLFKEEILKSNILIYYNNQQKVVYSFPQNKQLILESNQYHQFTIKIFNDAQLSNSPSNQRNQLSIKKFFNIQSFIEYLNNSDNIDSLGLNYHIAKLEDLQTRTKTKYKIIHHSMKNNENILILTQIDHNIIKHENYKFNKLIREIGGIFTHKLKTPLNTVLGYLNQAYEDHTVDSSTQINYIRPAYINSKLELFSVQDVLEYFNSESETGTLQICKINLKTMLYSLSDLITQQCKMKSITLKFYINDIRFNKFENIYIYSDVQKLERTLFNILHMSYRNTTQKGLITLNITFDKDLEEAEFKVADQGSELSQLEINEINALMNDNNFFKPIKKKLKFSQDMIMAIKITNRLIFSLNSLSNQSLEINPVKNGGCEYKFKISTSKDRSIDSSNDQYRIGYMLKQRSLKQLQTHHNISQKSIFSIQDPISNVLDISIEEPFANKPLVHTPIQHQIQHQIFEKHEAEKTESLSPKMLEKNKYILIVDDEPFNHDTLILMLKNMGFTNFLKAFDGQQAITIALQRQNEIFVVFMDLDMPILGGIEATKILVEGMLNQTINYFPIIGCTAHDDKDSHNQCQNAGMFSVVIKPVFIKTLKEAFCMLQEDPYKKSLQRIGSLLLH